MYKFYNREDYHHVPSVIINGETKKSVYNHNYYVSRTTGRIIFEQCDDDTCYDYYEWDTYQNRWVYLGCLFNLGGLFADDDDTDLPVKPDGSVELYDN